MQKKLVTDTTTKNNFLTPGKSTAKADPKKTSTLRESYFNKLRAAALFRPSLCAEVFKIKMTSLLEFFTKKQQMYRGNKSKLLKIFDPTSSLTLSLKKDTLILDFSAIVNSQATVTTAKTFNEISDGMNKFVQDLSCGFSRIDTVSDSYFDNSLKSHRREACTCGQFFLFTEATSIPKDFQNNFTKHNRNKVALNSFLAGKVLTHDFGGVIVSLSMNREIKCNSTEVSDEDVHIGRTQEEAATKIIVHVNIVSSIVSKVDNDVVTLSVAHPSLLYSPYEIEADFNFGKDRRFYKISDICSRITLE